MRQPLKRMHIYEDLKRSISAGVYHQGAFLPNELILAEKYGVSPLPAGVMIVGMPGCGKSLTAKYIAREFNSGSVFGEVFDPLADKMLILGAFIGLLYLERANAWAVFIILAREFYITGLRVVVANSRQNIAASSLGKYKTGFQILAIAFLLANIFPGGVLLLWIAVFVTLYSGLDYTLKYYKALKQ